MKWTEYKNNFPIGEQIAILRYIVPVLEMNQSDFHPSALHWDKLPNLFFFFTAALLFCPCAIWARSSASKNNGMTKQHLYACIPQSSFPSVWHIVGAMKTTSLGFWIQGFAFLVPGIQMQLLKPFWKRKLPQTVCSTKWGSARPLARIGLGTSCSETEIGLDLKSLLTHSFCDSLYFGTKRVN